MTASYQSPAALLAATLVGAAPQPTGIRGRSLISRGIFAAICALGALCLPALAGAQEAVLEAQDLIGGVPRRQIQATRLPDGERIVIDGRLDEGIWKLAEPARDFIQIDPQNGTPATEPTEVRIVISQDAFYMGVTAYDSEPDKWLGFQRRRDEFLSSDDRFMWRIDTFLDERSGYFFEMNPSGLMADAVFGVNGMNRAWDGIWNARVAPQRDRLDHRDRNTLPHAQLQPQQRHLGHQLPAHGAAQERRQHLDGMGAQPGARSHDQRRPRQGHQRGHAGKRARREAVRPGVRRVGTGRGLTGLGPQRERRRGRVLQPHAGAPRQRHGEHRLRADRGRPAPGQPDALLAVLPRAPRLLSRRRDVLRLREHQRQRPRHRAGAAVLQPPHRLERRRRARSASTWARSSPDRWADRTWASSSSAPATRTRRDSSARTSRPHA